MDIRGTGIACWSALGAYVLVAGLYAGYIAFLVHAQAVYDANPGKTSFGPLWCGNTIADPLTWLLNWASPIALAAALVLSRRARSSRTALQWILFALPTFGLLGFALWVFHGPWLGGVYRVADVVWWMIGV